MTPLLEIDALDASYGDFKALFGVSLSVDEGRVVAVIGANGAGKSTLMKAIAGTVRANAGEIRFGGAPMADMVAHRRVAAGVSLVPEGRRIFRSLTVDENLQVGAHTGREGPWNRRRVYDTFPLLERISSRSAARLSGGEQQTLAIGRALMNNPRLLLLDEVSLGLAPVVVKQLYAALPAITATGTTLLLVEQDVNQALVAADQIYCLLEGRVVLAGTPETLSRDQIASAYFGTATT